MAEIWKSGSMRRLLAALMGCAGAFASIANAQPVEEFYRGKTVRILVGYPPGSTFDLYARSLARHMPKHLAGSPNVIVQNMPGAGGLNAVANMANVAAKDGLTLALSNPQSTTTPLLDPKAAAFDPRRFNWIGSVTDDTTACAFWASDLRTLDDLKRREIVIGATGATGGSAIDGKLLGEIFGYKFKIISGYPGMIEVRLAAEKGEVDGQCGLPGATIKADMREQVASGKVAVPVQIGLKSNPDLPGVPNLMDSLVNPDDRAVARLVYAPLSYMRPVMAPEGVPAERVEALRAAFVAVMDDAQYRAEMTAQRLDVRPVRHAAISTLIEEIYSAAPATIERARRILGLGNR